MTIEEFFRVAEYWMRYLVLMGVTLGTAHQWIVKPLLAKNQRSCEAQIEREKQVQEDLGFVKQSLFYVFQALLYSRCMRIIERGSADLQEKQILEGLYKSYEKMGGNGVLHQLYEQAMAVKTT